MSVLQSLQALQTLPAIVTAALGVLAVAALLLLAGVLCQRRRMCQVREMLNMYVAVLDAIPMPIYWRDRELKLMNCNAAYVRICGQPRAALSQASIETVIQWMEAIPLTVEELERQYRQAMDAIKPVIEDKTMRLRAEPEPITMRHWSAPLHDGASGGVVGVVGGWLDVSERQRALIVLAEAHGRAEAAFRAKATFMASIGHDIRTPMNAIMGMLELTLMNDALAAPERQRLETALNAVGSLLSLTDDLMNLSKIEAGKLELRPSAESLRDIAREVADMFSPAASSNGVALMVEIAPAVAEYHFVDLLRLKQILNNLVSNAVRFTQQGQIHLRAKTAGASEAGQWVQFLVADTGCGISSDTLPMLFEPFFVPAGVSETEGGVGLGLPICKRLVDAMDGHIRIRSKPGRGTQVMVRLPLPAVAAPVAVANPTPPLRVLEPILVVDDQASNRILLKHQLHKLGHACVCVENGSQALAAADRQVFKLVICDCAMPHMNGVEFIRALRARQNANAGIPVLGYTAGAQEADAQEGLDAGMNAVLLKPVGLAELKEALQTHLPQQAAPSPQRDG